MTGTFNLCCGYRVPGIDNYKTGKCYVRLQSIRFKSWLHVLEGFNFLPLG